MSFLFVIAVFYQQDRSEIATELHADSSSSNSLLDSDLEINEENSIVYTFDFNLLPKSFVGFDYFYASSKVKASPMPIWQPPQLST